MDWLIHSPTGCQGWARVGEEGRLSLSSGFPQLLLSTYVSHDPNRARLYQL